MRFGRRWRRIGRVLDWWRETGRWWEGEEEKEFMRLQAGGVHVVYRPMEGAGEVACEEGRRGAVRQLRQWFLLGTED